MEDFTKILRIGTTADAGDLFCKVQFKDGRLSIIGVEGPKRNGDAKGSCGQIVMREWNIATYAPGWDADLVARFRDVWDRWHLNDMRAYSSDMAAAGWAELARRRMAGHKFTKTADAIKASNAAEGAALAALRAGQAFQPTPEQAQAAALPYSVVIWLPEGMAPPEAPEGYEPARHIGGHMAGVLERPEIKTLGRLKPSDHPEGLMGRKLNPSDTYGYGGKWWKEDVPADILAFLKSLPSTDKQPAWV